MVQLQSPRHRWTREEFYKIVESGCFRADAHLELIQGDIIEKELPMNTPHATGVRRGENMLRKIFSSGYVVSAQLPLTLSNSDEPLPDLAVSAGSPEDFEESHPTSAVLIVEISDSSLKYDRTAKAQLYASFNVLDYWILNLIDRVLEVYREPNGAKYLSIRTYDAQQAVAPLAASDRSISVSSLLPARKSE
jgi:Uma2 family endonuclease